MNVCDVDGCGRPSLARGWCHTHYQVEWKRGLPPLDTRKLEGRPHVCEKHPEPSHACYVAHRCRCDGCRQATADYERRRVRRNAAGRTSMIDPSATRQHLNMLLGRGVGIRTISEATGISRLTLREIAEGRTGRVTRRVADAVAACDLGHGRYIAVDGELRRHLAAMKERLSWRQMAATTGMSAFHLSKLLARECQTTPETRSRLLAIPLPCVDCGQPSMAGGLRCGPCFSAQAKPKPASGCGTEAGYAAHRRAGTSPCGPCKTGHARYQRLQKEAS